jgi:ABC-type phosphate/phosphonate transport system substrate-binding protein
VLNGDFDAGGIMESTAHKFKDMGLKLIKFSDDIPEFNICTSEGLDPVMREGLKKVLISITRDVPECDAILKSINPNYTGFTEASDEDYNQIRLMMSKMGMI